MERRTCMYGNINTNNIGIGSYCSAMPVFRPKPEFVPLQFIFRPYVSDFCVQIEQFLDSFQAHSCFPTGNPDCFITGCSVYSWVLLHERVLAGTVLGITYLSPDHFTKMSYHWI